MSNPLLQLTNLMKGDDLVPLKRVLERVGVARVTLWRALNSGLEMPKPTILRRRLFWKAREIQVLDQALDSYRGRIVFEARRHQNRLLSELRMRAAAQKSRRKSRREERADAVQLELFTFEHQVQR